MILHIIFLILLIDGGITVVNSLKTVIDDGIEIIDLPTEYEVYVKDDNCSYGYINTRGFFINY